MKIYGNKSPKDPWNDPNGAAFIGNELRRCHFVGLHMTWPVPGPPVGTETTHVITIWGDEGDPNELTSNPARFFATDSDRDDPNDVQVYAWDAYDDPLHQDEEGPGWYFDYTEPLHPYALHIAVLEPAPAPVHCQGNQYVVESYAIEQEDLADATGLVYVVGTDTDICAYETTIDRHAPDPTIVELDPAPPESLDVTWDLSGNPVGHGETVRITTRFWLPTWNAIYYDDVQFTYDKRPDAEPYRGRSVKPAFYWCIETPQVPDPNIYVPGMCGGFVVGAFELYDDPNGQIPLGEVRLQHQYSYDQQPEQHMFRLESRQDRALYVGQLRFGHSYMLLDNEAMWALGPADWLPLDPNLPDVIPLDPNLPVQIDLHWPGLLPYPLCGPVAPPVCRGDCNCDGQIDFGDINGFVMAIVDGVYCDGTGENSDVNEDGLVTFADINPFVVLLTTNPVPLDCP